MKFSRSLFAALSLACLAVSVGEANIVESNLLVPARPVDINIGGGSTGHAVAVSGDIVLSGSAFSSEIVYVFDANTGKQLRRLEGPTGGGYGSRVAIEGDYAIVSAPTERVNDVRDGAVYLYHVPTWEPIAKLVAPNTVAGNSNVFGGAIAMHGTTAIIGARGTPGGHGTGVAHVYDLPSGDLISTLVPNVSSASFFGVDVAIHGSMALVSDTGAMVNGFANGAAYLFDIATGVQIAQFVPDDPSNRKGFGYGLGLSDSTIVAGGAGDSTTGTGAGAAYLFDIKTGKQTFKLLPSHGGGAYWGFGYAAAMRGDMVLIGEPGSDFFSAIYNSGSAFVFDAKSGKELLHIPGVPQAPIREFGTALALSAERIIIGAPGEVNPRGHRVRGAVHTFDINAPVASSVVRNGSGVNARILSASRGPSLGTPWEVVLDARGHDPSMAILAIYSRPEQEVFIRAGELLIDLTSPRVLQLRQMHTGGQVMFKLQVPDDASLCGLKASAQAAVLGLPGLELSNAIDLVVGI